MANAYSQEGASIGDVELVDDGLLDCLEGHLLLEHKFDLRGME